MTVLAACERTSHLHDDRLAQILARERLDLGRHRRAEEQRLPVLRNLGDDAIDLRREAHVEHAVGLVEHEHLEIVEDDVLALEVVDQPARRRDDDVDAGAQRFSCGSRGTPPYTDGDVELHCARVFRERSPRTCTAELARRREHERARAARSAEQAVDDRERERGGLAGARLREAHDVASLEDERDGLGLNGRRCGVAGIGDGAEELGREHQLGEAHGRDLSLVCR